MNKNNRHRIMALLIDHPRMTLTEMSLETGIPISTIHEQLKKIEEGHIFRGFWVWKK